MGSAFALTNICLICGSVAYSSVCDVQLAYCVLVFDGLLEWIVIMVYCAFVLCCVAFHCLVGIYLMVSSVVILGEEN